MLLTALLATVMLLLPACNAQEQYFIFGTVVDFHLTGVGASAAEKKIADMLEELDGKLSTQIADSDVSRVNEAKPGVAVAVSDETFSLLLRAKQIYTLTDGAFNPALYPLVELWKFSPDKFTLAGSVVSPPSAEQIAETLALCSFDFFLLDENTKTVTKTVDGAKIDLGAIAKGYAAQKSAEMVKGQTGYINVGGNIYSVGTSVTVGISSPRDTGHSYIGKLEITSSITTSGDYERYYTLADGTRLCHIIDGRTGAPASGGLVSVTVLGEDGALCDALSTAVFVLGKTDGASLLKKAGVAAVLVEDGTVYTVNCGSFVLTDTDNYVFGGAL